MEWVPPDTVLGRLSPHERGTAANFKLDLSLGRVGGFSCNAVPYDIFGGPRGEQHIDRRAAHTRPSLYSCPWKTNGRYSPRLSPAAPAASPGWQMPTSPQRFLLASSHLDGQTHTCGQHGRKKTVQAGASSLEPETDSGAVAIAANTSSPANDANSL